MPSYALMWISDSGWEFCAEEESWTWAWASNDLLHAPSSDETNDPFDIGKLTCLEYGWINLHPKTNKSKCSFTMNGTWITSPSPFVILWGCFIWLFHVETFNLQGPTLWKCLGERTTWDVSDDDWWIVWIMIGKKNCGSFGMMQNLVSRDFCHLGRTLMKPWNRMADDKTTLCFISLCKTSGGSSHAGG